MNMNNELEKDYLFHINWEDQSKNFHRVGFLAKISQNYYFVVTNDNQLTSAYKEDLSVFQDSNLVKYIKVVNYLTSLKIEF